MSTSENSQGKMAELKRTRNDDERLVSFSKRRASIYKKASEISVLCGAQVGIIIFSPSDKPFTYGAPNIEAVVNWFSGRGDQDVADLALEAQSNTKVQEINDMHNDLIIRRDLSIKEGNRLTDITTPIQHNFWWHAPLENLNHENIEKLAESMKRIKDGATKIDEKFIKTESTIDVTDIASRSTMEKPINDANNIASSSNS